MREILELPSSAVGLEFVAEEVEEAEITAAVRMVALLRSRAAFASFGDSLRKPWEGEKRCRPRKLAISTTEVGGFGPAEPST